MIKVRTTMQPDRDLEVSTLAELKDLARQGLVEDATVPNTTGETSNRTPATTGDK